MLRRVFLSALFLLLGVGAIATGVGISFAFRGAEGGSKKVEPQVLPATHRYEEVPTLPVTLSEGIGNSTRYFDCQQINCRPKVAPNGIGSSAQAVGDSWYFYQDESLKKLTPPDTESSLIISPTELITPRDIIPSPTGGAVAYWLDNTTKDGDGLTELWVYDAAHEGAFVVAENLVAADVVTEPKWNSSGTALWFLADSGSGSAEQLELIVVTTEPASVAAKFPRADIGLLQKAAERSLVALNPSTSAIAFVEDRSATKNVLRVWRDDAQIAQKQIAGRIVYLEWSSEGDLVYAVQQGPAIEFWRFSNATHTLMGKYPGVLLFARLDPTGRYLAYTTSERANTIRLFVFDVAKGLSRAQSTLSGQGEVGIAHVGALHEEGSGLSATEALPDSQLIAFVEKQADEIIGEEHELIRIVMTEKPNTLFIDYTIDQATRRALVLIRDVIHPEWQVLGHYEPVGAGWKRSQGATSTTDPEAVRLYEWEEEASQWILKQALDK